MERPPEAEPGLERRAAMLLMSVEGLGPVTFYRLLAARGSARTILELAASDAGRRELLGHLGSVAEPGQDQARRPAQVVAGLATVARDATAITDRLAALGLTWLSIDDRSYPARLRFVEVPPPVLFIRGPATALSAHKVVAIVGTRRATESGRRIAARIANALARLGVVVVSGLALGIDGAAHEATVTAGGTTVAVLGSGHERLFPRAHARLADRIVETGGALVSELPPDSFPTQGTFPRRNRVISGLSDATIVVEAAARSGALITAAWALEQGRACFAVPGSIDAPASAGCLAFLHAYPDQVRIVAGIPDLIEDLHLSGQQTAPGTTDGPSSRAPQPAPAAVLASLGPAERAVAGALLAGSATVDDLARRTDLPVATVLGTLTLLELRALVTAAGGRYRLAGALLGAGE
ncbi:MAG TPA: DNA-processing protein DprA [Candidatus Limnocylindrales bacterium]|nr:DNA-processing protein DprA [Candidatus Limnocylindrales bacterium]